jgi:biopolymer transport protein ExbB
MSGFLFLQISTTNDLTAGQKIPAEISMALPGLASEGTWLLILLGLMLLVACYIFIDRYITIRRASREDKNFMNNIRDFIHDGRLDAALSLCRNTESPIARMIEKGLSRIGRPLGDINTAIENVGTLEVSKLEKNIAVLATIAGAAPMLGFLGTVAGMVIAFYKVSVEGNNVDIAHLSSSIYQALIPTLGGLIVGILAYLSYNILVSRIEKLVFLLELRAAEFMDLLYEPSK